MSRELVERAMHGDREAFSEIADRALRRLVGTAGLIAGSRVAAEDATQEALIQAWRDLPSLRDPERFESWLYRLLVRACSRQRRRERHELPIDSFPTDNHAWMPDSARGVAARDEIERGLRRLTPQQRTIVVLRYYAGMSEAEIATAVEVPVGTVKSRLHRSLSALRAELDADTRAALAGERVT